MFVKPFKVGDRVEVLDIDQTNGRICKDSGTILAAKNTVGVCKIAYDNWASEYETIEGKCYGWHFCHFVRRIKK